MPILALATLLLLVNSVAWLYGHTPSRTRLCVEGSNNDDDSKPRRRWRLAFLLYLNQEYTLRTL